MTDIRARDLIAELDEASLSKFHLRAVLVSGMGFFTDAYDLFVIGGRLHADHQDWNLSSSQTSWVTGLRDPAARSSARSSSGGSPTCSVASTCTRLVAAIMIVGALASALAPASGCLVVARFVLGLRHRR